ncbi:MAG TPA: hypothetical protein VMF07_06075 [Solirubrobacteraceae bacterium]|nr:hypothetical protein [Solirubrobacteraceae bacterium]
MGPDPLDSPPPRVERFFDALLARDGAGGSWLGPLLCAAPNGPARFGELAEHPGWLEAPIAVHTETGRRGAFEYPASPPRGLLGWFIDHPHTLSRSEQESASAETVRLHRALLDDDPPGARARAQDRAHDLLRRSAPFADAWWRFEEAHTADCLLMTSRLVLMVQARDEGVAPPPATPWFPGRTALVRDLEAARRFGEGGKAWGVLVLGTPDRPEDADALTREIAAGAPHLDAAERHELAAGYLGALSWAQATAATGAPAP